MTKATVTQASPLRIRLDGASSDSAARTFAHLTLALGDRVWAASHSGRLFVHGKVA